jgi:hypothetical protein
MVDVSLPPGPVNHKVAICARWTVRDPIVNWDVCRTAIVLRVDVLWPPGQTVICGLSHYYKVGYYNGFPARVISRGTEERVGVNVVEITTGIRETKLQDW